MAQSHSSVSPSDYRSSTMSDMNGGGFTPVNEHGSPSRRPPVWQAPPGPPPPEPIRRNQPQPPSNGGWQPIGSDAQMPGNMQSMPNPLPNSMVNPIPNNMPNSMPPNLPNSMSIEGPPPYQPHKRFGSMDNGRDERRSTGSNPLPSPIQSGGPRSHGENADLELRNGPHPTGPTSPVWGHSNGEPHISTLINRDPSRPEFSSGGSADGSVDTPSHAIGGSTADGGPTNGGIQVDVKKRKRAFTNRTKTGCQTCRRRKKKCDEAKPHCNNCTRGGFTCLGYPQARDISGRAMHGVVKAPPLAMKSREPWTHPSGPPSAGYETTSFPPHAIPSTRFGPSVDDGMHPSAPPMGWGQPPPPPPPPQQQHHAARSVGAERLSDGGRSLPPPVVPQYAQTRAPTNLMSYTNGAKSYSPMLSAQKAMRENQVGYPAMSMSASEKMKAGNMFLPSDIGLAKDREKCRMTCGRFNNLSLQGSSYDERMRVFGIIIHNDENAVNKKLWANVHVDSPFRAEYGYNLRLSDNVTIEAGCYIKDLREVYIGSGTRIGMNVTICGELAPRDHDMRQYSKGIPIDIGQNVYVGSGATIAVSEQLNKLSIGDGAYICSGAVVTSDVRAGETVYAGCRHSPPHPNGQRST